LITIFDLRRERGVLCEWCGEREAIERHHALIHDIKRWHDILTVKENIMQACEVCHRGECVLNGYDVRVKFWQIQCARYGVEHMEDWVNSLPVKLTYSRRIDFVNG